MADKYRKKPVVIEAVLWRGYNTLEICHFIGIPGDDLFKDGELYIKTLEGVHHASVGDFIIKGVKGEFYPCKPDIFAQTYEAVSEGGKKMRLIECRSCDATNCEGCNLLTLADMLHKGKLDCLMDEHHSIVIEPESPRPVGEWDVIDGEDWNEDVIYKCSICKEEFVTIDGTPAENLWNYCPNCGAKMEG